ncbi:MAG: hypothetical protein ACOCZ5_02840 [bacterium]
MTEWEKSLIPENRKKGIINNQVPLVFWDIASLYISEELGLIIYAQIGDKEYAVNDEGIRVRYVDPEICPSTGKRIHFDTIKRKFVNCECGVCVELKRMVSEFRRKWNAKNANKPQLPRPKPNQKPNTGKDSN